MDTNRFTQKSLEALQAAQQLAQSYGCLLYTSALKLRETIGYALFPLRGERT